MSASATSTSYQWLKAKVAAADDIDEMMFFLNKAADAAGMERVGHLLMLIPRLQQDGCIQQAQASQLREIATGGKAAAAPEPATAPPLPSPPPSVVMVDAPSLVGAAFHAPAVGISSAHHVTERGTLQAYLGSLGLESLVADLENGMHTDGPAWYAEHARMQLAAGSGCDSKPAWVARVSDAPSSSQGLLGVREVAFWAADGKAARRGLLALHLEAGGLSVALVAWGLPSSDYTAQLERWAYEHEGYELQPQVAQIGSTGAAPGGAFVATLRALDGPELEQLRRKRSTNAEPDLCLARSRLEELSERLLALDPKATMQVAPGEKAGTYILNQLQFRGHLMEFATEIDRHSSVEALVQVATHSCLCCAGGDPTSAEDLLGLGALGVAGDSY